jgi:hypothetical protein
MFVLENSHPTEAIDYALKLWDLRSELRDHTFARLRSEREIRTTLRTNEVKCINLITAYSLLAVGIS